jgi:NCS1 family nucleobase:cation symporter-1
MACVWWGVQAWLGGECVYVLIRTLAPGFANMKNLMPASSETTSGKSSSPSSPSSTH